MFYPRFFGMPAWRVKDPFEELNRVRRQMDRIMESFPDRPASPFSAGVFPAINLTEDEDNFYLRAELPGVKSEDVDIQATPRNLTLSGERRLDPQDESARYHRREREAGKFSRAFAMPREIDPGRVEARLSSGILTVRVPKAEAAKPRKIQIAS
jgi:HSP20 family protein